MTLAQALLLFGGVPALVVLAVFAAAYGSDWVARLQGRLRGRRGSSAEDGGPS